MSSPESAGDDLLRGYAAAQAVCGRIVELRDLINGGYGRGLVSAEELEGMEPGCIEELKELGAAAIGQPVRGTVGDEIHALDTPDADVVQQSPRRSPVTNRRSVVGAFGGVSVKDWETVGKYGRLYKGLLVVRIEPVAHMLDPVLHGFYDSLYRNGMRDSNYINQPLGIFKPTPEAVWLRYQDIETLEAADLHLTDVNRDR